MSWAGIVENLLLPMQIPLLQNSFITGTLLALATALLSPFLVLKGQALVGDAIAHAILPGIVLALMLGFSPFLGAVITAFLCVGAAHYLQRATRIKPDTSLGIVFSGLFGIGLVLYVRMNIGADIHHILFGDMLGTSAYERWRMGVIAALIVLFIALKWRALMLYSFDPIQAHSAGIRTGWLYFVFLLLLVCSTVSTIMATGIILAIAFLIAPGVISFMITARLDYMLVLSVVISLVANFLGIYISFFVNSAPAPTIVLVMFVVFLFVYLLQRNKSHLRR